MMSTLYFPAAAPDLSTTTQLFRILALCALTLFDPGGERLLEVLVLLECDWGAHLGGQYHLGVWGALA